MDYENNGTIYFVPLCYKSKLKFKVIFYNIVIIAAFGLLAFYLKKNHYINLYVFISLIPAILSIYNILFMGVFGLGKLELTDEYIHIKTAFQNKKIKFDSIYFANISCIYGKSTTAYVPNSKYNTSPILTISYFKEPNFISKIKKLFEANDKLVIRIDLFSDLKPELLIGTIKAKI